MNTSAKDARALLAVKLGDGQPLVPADAQGQGPGAMVAAALRRLAGIKRPPARVLYQRASDVSEPHACSGRCNTDDRESRTRLFSDG